MGRDCQPPLTLMDIKRSDQLVSIGKIKVSGDVYDWLDRQADRMNNAITDPVKRVLNRVTVEDVVRAIIRRAKNVLEDHELEMIEPDPDEDGSPF